MVFPVFYCKLGKVTTASSLLPCFQSSLPARNGQVTTEPIKPFAWNFWTWGALASRVGNLMWTWELLARVLRSGWLRGKESACQYRRCWFHPWHRKIPWRRKWQPTQYSYLENSMDREAWQATAHGVAKSRTWLSDLAHAVGPAHNMGQTHRFLELVWVRKASKQRKAEIWISGQAQPILCSCDLVTSVKLA